MDLPPGVTLEQPCGSPCPGGPLSREGAVSRALAVGRSLLFRFFYPRPGSRRVLGTLL
jgi:hypothetical protein